MKLKKTLTVVSAALGLLFGSSGLAISEHATEPIVSSPRAAVASMASSFDGQTKTSGTSSTDPLVISNESQYLLFINNLKEKTKQALNSDTTVTWATAYYKITSDLDMSLITSSIKPIFTEDVIANPSDYNIHIDGGNHEIRNYKFDKDSIAYAETTNQASCGVFAVFRGEVKDLAITYAKYDVQIPGRTENYALGIGGFAGVTLQASLNNVHVDYNCNMNVTYTVSGDAYDGESYYYMGGLVGFAGIQSSIINCSATCSNNTFMITSNALQGYFGALCGVLKQSMECNSFSYISKVTLTSNRDGNPETYLGLVNGLVHDSVIQNVYSDVESKEYRNTSTTAIGTVTYLGIIFGNASQFERVFVFDPSGKDAAGQDIVEAVYYSDIKTTSAGVPVTLNSPVAYVESTVCAYHYGMKATSDTEIDDSKVYYTRTTNPYATAMGEVRYLYTAVETPAVGDIAYYYEENPDTVCKFTSQSTPFIYDGRSTKRTLEVALDNYTIDNDSVTYIFQTTDQTATLNGWYFSESSNNGITYMAARFEGRIYTITYAETTKGYTISDASAPQYYIYGTGVTELPSAVVMNGYTFDGWYLNANYSGNQVTSISKDSIGDITLYAKFIKESTTIPTHVIIIIAVVVVGLLTGTIIAVVKMKKYKNTYHKQKNKKNENSPF